MQSILPQLQDRQLQDLLQRHYTDIFNLFDLIEGSVRLLSTTTISLAADADTTIYTVPKGYRCLLDHAKLVAGADAGTSDISIGADGSETDFLGPINLDNLDAQYDWVLLAPVPSATPAKLKSYAAETVIQAKVENQAGGATNTLYLYGMLYKA